jgi:hypothetical protein
MGHGAVWVMRGMGYEGTRDFVTSCAEVSSG